MESSEEKKKELLIKKKIREIEKVYKNLDENKKKIVMPLIQKAAFMDVELEILQEIISKDGATCEYQNGENQFGTKKSPEVDIYNVMVKNYTNVIKILAELAPAAEKKNNKLALLRME